VEAEKFAVIVVLIISEQVSDGRQIKLKNIETIQLYTVFGEQVEYRCSIVDNPDMGVSFEV
jgi:hypothetical protein